jgi:hypothetical protein
MDGFDWTRGPTRPLSSADVWELLRNGCNAHEIATAAGVTLATAIGMINEATPHAKPLETLHLRSAA